jgi:hypothetical protein
MRNKKRKSRLENGKINTRTISGMQIESDDQGNGKANHHQQREKQDQALQHARTCRRESTG